MAVKRHIRLECSICNSINYLTFKNSKKVIKKLELKKYCPKCKKATIHKETKKK